MCLSTKDLPLDSPRRDTDGMGKRESRRDKRVDGKTWSKRKKEMDSKFTTTYQNSKNRVRCEEVGADEGKYVDYSKIT